VAVEAWQLLRSSGIDVTLAVVGGGTVPAQPGIVSTGRLDDQTWAALLAGAQAFCYPTRYEGFGLPALESIASGTPVVCAPVGPLPEILGAAAEWSPTPTNAAMVASLRHLLCDRQHAAHERRRGFEQATLFTWEAAAAALLRAYHEASIG
jgi:glycosyltransferase involved in cell wall biosynthesis